MTVKLGEETMQKFEADSEFSFHSLYQLISVFVSLVLNERRTLDSLRLSLSLQSEF